ncbi:hypothetical protein D9619_012255 [Psilocybe cf. subviscida]|uniref:Piwi domain-containing protein n=1 Tax=Psilocybe cf. subviscida TaxID=2480587 RepID=A0A8H5B858_9AGAR|nr:hypothetical protein D9619_012255 [Psilocybe cf. subviscida]
MAAIQVKTNTFQITQLPRNPYKQYDAFSTFDKQEVYAQKKKLLFAHLVDVVDPAFFDKRPIFDGRAIAYSPKDLGPGGHWTVSLGSKTPVEANKKGGVTVRITATASELVDPRHVKDLIEGGRNTDRALVATNLLQLIVRQAANKNKTNNGRASFTPEDSRQFRGPSGFEVWLGFFQSVRPTVQRMILNIDTVAAVVYKHGNLLNLAMSEMGLRDAHRLRLQENELDFRKLQDFLKGVEITLPAAGGTRRTKKIRGLVPSAAEYLFNNESEGRDMTVKDYWEANYGVVIRNRNIVGVRLTGKNHPRPQVVPLEVCEVVPGQLYKKKLPDNLVGEMVRFSAVSPAERWARIQRGANQHTNSQHLAESGMQINNQPVTVQGLLLPVPDLEYAPNSRPVTPRDGKWNVVNTQFHDPKTLEYWALINFCPTSLGMSKHREGAPPSTVYICNPQAGVEQNLDNAMRNLMSARPDADGKNIGTVVLIILLPENAGPIRTALKNWGDIKCGIITLCAREGKLRRKPGDNQYWNNQMLKINARLGGRNSIVRSPVLAQLKADPFMIMGKFWWADVGHPGVGVQRPSMTSLVYSHDDNATQYAAITGIQSPRVEIIEELFRFVCEAVDSFGAKNQVSPKRVFFFRDGLSEGEFTKVAEREIHQIKEAFKAVFTKREIKAPLPLLVYIIVGKRHHITLYPGNREAEDRTGNCRAGTVVHSEITHPAHKDFYLQSHAAIQGTSRSSHYTVIEDEVWGKKRIDLIQQLAFSLCHVYAKATRSVSIPAPVYYADLVCSRLNFHMDPSAPTHLFSDTGSVSSGSGPSFNLDLWKQHFKPIHNRLSKTMYFL